ncbi:hypothetical protein GCM10020221_09260 [Streptomyces thioluteus]|uniref:Penicillin-binding protein n=1 Tax=Streptomyces thioluteus TaxID=66431 RepID=A0ABN3WHF5_STRTU
MNKPVRRVALFSGLLVLSLLIRSTWLQFAQADELANNEHNRRVKINTYAQPRGDIVVGGNPVTGSAPTTGGDLKYKRTYKNGPMYAPVTGYTSQIYGSNQLEYVYNKFLTGTDDKLFLQRTTDMLSGKKPQGGDVVTTIDPKAQKAAYEGLAKYKGAAVAIDPSTGRILALASTPSYDPSVFSGEGSKDQKAWEKLEKDKDKPLSNRAIKELYPSGSTFKILTAAAAIDHGLYTDINAPTDSPYPWNLPDTVTPMKNENESAPCRNASLKVAMQYSCNNVFAKIAAELGQDKMRETAEKFGFDKDVFMPVSVVKSIYPTKLNRPQTALTGIGQGDLRATPFPDRHDDRRHRQRRQADEADPGGQAARPGPVHRRADQARDHGPGRLPRDREEAPGDDGVHGQGGHRQGGADRRHHRRRQDRHRTARREQRQDPVRLVRLLRQAGRRLPGRGRGLHRPGGLGRRPRRRVRRRARGTDREEDHGSGHQEVSVA